MGITGGSGATIKLYNDADSAGGDGYTFAEISAALPTDLVDLSTNRASYRAVVDIQIGDTSQGVATTTLKDTNVTVIFNSGKTIRVSGTTNTYLRLGTKVGTGDEASGVDGCDITLGAAPVFVRNCYLYGCTFRQTSGAFLMTANGTDAEAINCMWQSAVTTAAPFSLGAAGGEWGNLYNVDLSHKTTSQVMSNFNALAARRMTISAPTPTVFLQGGATGVLAKDLALFGSPTTSDLRWSGGSAINWKLVRPIWSGNADKFSTTSAHAALQDPDSGCQEYWLFDVKCTDSAGVGVASIPVKLTDSDDNVQVNTTTDSTGQISFGSGITAKGVVVMDHYLTGTTYTQRHRSPFLMEVNYPTQTGYNANYQSHRFYFNWPGYQSITSSAGSFEDCNIVLSMAPPSSGGSTWTERTVP